MGSRKNYFIKKKFQASFALQFIVLLFIETALIGGLLMRLSDNTLTTGYLDSILRIETTRDFFFMPFVLMTLIVVVGIGIAGMIVFVLLSHRIAGPLYRFEHTLEGLHQGDLRTRISLRKTDQLTDLEKKLNALMAELDQRLGLVKTDVREIKNLLSEAKGAKNIPKIVEKINNIENKINHFKVTADESRL